MAKDLKPIDITHTPEVLRLAEEVAKSGIPRILRRDNEDVAEIRPVSAALKSRKKQSKTRADYEAFMSSFGSWKDFDVERFHKDLDQSRKLNSPPVQL